MLKRIGRKEGRVVEVGVDSEVSMICTEAHESFWFQILAIWEVASRDNGDFPKGVYWNGDPHHE